MACDPNLEFDPVSSREKTETQTSPKCFSACWCPSSTASNTPPSDEPPSIVDSPRMRVSRSPVELLGTPGRGLPVHPKLHHLHGHAHSFSLSWPTSTLNPHAQSKLRPHSPIHSTRNVSRRQAHTTTHRTDRASVLSSSGYSPGFGPYVPGQPTHLDGRNKYRAALESLFAALRKSDVVELYFCLLELTRGAHENDPFFCEEIQSIPTTTFSEILHCFDPVNISNHLDSAPELNITYGAALFTPLGELVNKWGVKVLYVRIFNRLRLLQRARRVTQDHRFRPLLSDYAIVLKWAGATSDIGAANQIWSEMREDGYADWRHAGLYAEYVKTRWLTESLYANHDLARLRLRPLDMYRSSVRYPRRIVRSLHHIKENMTKLQTHRFGQNVSELYFAEPLTRLFRRRQPLMSLERRSILRRMIPGEEKLVCAFLKANGRQGRISDSLKLLASCWQILAFRDRETREYRIEGGKDSAPGSAQAPTAALLDAVVHCFANMGEINLAVKLVDFISKRFCIPVPDKVWSDLLDFARILKTKPARTEWATAQFRDKIAKQDTTFGIWELCTQEPYNFKPGIHDYYNLTKSLIQEKNSISGPLEAMRQIKPLYDEATEKMRVAWLELLLTTQQRVANRAVYRRYRVAQSRKHYIWHCFHYAGRQMLKLVKPGRTDDSNAVRHIPDLIGEFGSFLRVKVKYRTATGMVELHNDASRLKGSFITQEVEQPRPLTERPSHVEATRDKQDLALGWEEGDEDLSFTTTETRRDREGLSIRQRGGLASEIRNVQKERRAEYVNVSVTDEDMGKVVDRSVPPGKRFHDAFEESRTHRGGFSTPSAAQSPDKTPSGNSFEDAFLLSHQQRSTDVNPTSHLSDDWDKEGPASPQFGDHAEDALSPNHQQPTEVYISNVGLHSLTFVEVAGLTSFPAPR